MAKTSQGAVELLRCGLVAHLIECQVFDMVPDSDAHRWGSDELTVSCCVCNIVL